MRAFLYTRGMDRFHSHRRSEAIGDPLPQQARLWNQFRGRVGNGCSRQRREERIKMRNLFIGLFVVLALLMSGCGSNSYTQPGPPGTQYPADISGTYTFTLVGTGNFSFPWCSPDSFTATGQLFFTPGNPETFAFAIFDNTVSSNLLIINSADFSKLAGTWQEGTAFTCVPIPSGNLTWTAVRN